MSDAAGRRPRLPAVTGVRFVAASHVVLLHYLPKYQLLLAPWWVQNIVGAGYVGVDLFFILSGFVLAYTYLRSLDGPRVDARRFWAARFARIYPLYALSLALAAAFWLPAFLAQGGSKRDALLFPLAAAAMLQAWSPKIATVVNYPAWSLSIEAFFYLSFPLLAPPFARLRGRALVAAAGLLWLGALAAPLLYTGLNPDGIGAGIPDHPARWLRAPSTCCRTRSGTWSSTRRGRWSRRAHPATPGSSTGPTRGWPPSSARCWSACPWRASTPTRSRPAAG